MRRIAERIRGDPRPAVRRVRRPPAVVVRLPVGRDMRVPDVAVRLLIAPVAVLIERRRIARHVLRQVLLRLTGRRIDRFVLHLDPAIEVVRVGRVVGVGVRRQQARARVGALAGADRRRPLIGEDLAGAARHREFELRVLRAVEERDTIVAWLQDAHGPGGGVDAIADLLGGAHDAHAKAPVGEPHEVVREDVDRRARIQIQAAAVGKADFDAAILRLEPIAAQQRHVEWGAFDPAVTLEGGRAVHDGHVRGCVEVCRRGPLRLWRRVGGRRRLGTR